MWKVFWRYCKITAKKVTGYLNTGMNGQRGKLLRGKKIGDMSSGNVRLSLRIE